MSNTTPPHTDTHPPVITDHAGIFAKSPDDQSIEQEIQAKGLTAPRVTLVDIEASIASEYYFTAAEGVYSAEVLNSEMISTEESLGPLGMLTFCVLVLRNGFTVTGESACVSPDNFDAAEGRKWAREKAIDKIWPLMGYALKERLYQAIQPAQSPE